MKKLVLICLFAAGCAPSLVERQANEQARINEAVAAIDTECREMHAQIDQEPLEKIIPRETRDISTRHVAIERGLTAEELALFLARQDINTQCKVLAQDFVNSNLPLHATAVNDLNAKGLSASVLLAKSEVSIGQYNAMRQFAYAEFLQEVARIDGNISKENAAAEERRKAQQQAAALALLQLGQQQSQLGLQQSTVNAPRSTNCRWIGQTWSCQTF